MLGFDTLELFLAVADHGSFTRAAINLAMTQSTVSKRIQQLENELGARLLYRDGRGVKLTEDGARFADVARTIFHQIDSIKADFNEGTHSLRGSVTVGLPPSLGSSLSVPLTLRFKEKFPSASLRIIEAFSGSLLELLEAGKLDTAILYDARVSPTMLVSPLFKENLYLIESAASPAMHESATLAELGIGSFVLAHSSNGLRRVLEEASAALHLSIDIYAELDSLTALKRVTELGLARGILPYGAVYREVNEGKLRARPFLGPGLSAVLVCATPLHRSVRRLAKEMQLLLREQIEESIADGILTGSMLR